MIGLFLFLFVQLGYGQINLTQNSNVQTLAQLLAGQGVTISNYTKNAATNATGTFTNSNTNLGLGEGVVMATGRVQDIAQPANNFASTQFSNTNDAQLSTLTSGTIYDNCSIEFDIIPQGNTLQFNYVFASEEYPEFVCSPYNDVFGFFISGPNPSGGNYSNKDIATIPNSSTPVFINSVNPGVSGTYNGTTWNSNNCQSLTNTAYYINNLSPVNPNIVYDGMTTVLQAQVSVTPCQVYHLKLAIADVGDRIYDSGVFLEAHSFSSSSVNVSATAQLDYAGFTSAYEGCVDGNFQISLSSAQPVNDTIPLQITGSATNGTDYNFIPPFVIIPAGQTSVSIPLVPIADSITEVAEDVTISVLNPCTGAVVSSATIPIEDKLPIQISVADSTLCFGQSTQLSVAGGLSYSWSPALGLSNTNIHNPIATPATTTNYSVDVTFGACTEVLSQTVYVSHPTLNLSANPNGLVCNGDTAVIYSTINGGVAPYSFAWNNSDTTAGIKALQSGNYQLTVTDLYGCTAVASDSVTISDLKLNAVSGAVNCYQGTDGSITLTATGGQVPYQYQWNNGYTGNARFQLGAGSYTATVTDADGCSVTASAMVIQPDSALFLTAVPTEVTCFGSNDGRIQLSVSGGTLPYTYQWNNGQSSTVLTQVTAGNYSVTVSDSHHCSVTASTHISEPAALSHQISKTDVACFGASTGQITVNASGGTEPYSFIWNDGSTLPNRTNLTAGNYSVTVTDTHACYDSVFISVDQALLLSGQMTIDSVTCFGGHNGSVALSVTGGTPPYSYLWNTNDNHPSLTNLSSGVYAVTVHDALQCAVQFSATVAEPPVLAVSTIGTDVTCFGGHSGSVQLNVIGGTPTYSFTWNNGTHLQNMDSISSGNYSVTVTDVHGCSVSASQTIAEPTSGITLNTSTTNISCYQGSDGVIQLQVNGGTAPYSYQWGNGDNSPSLFGVSSGLYQVTVTDSHQCSASATTQIFQPASALQVNASSTNVNCHGASDGSVQLTVTGGTPGYQYQWNNGSHQQTLANISAGAYSVTISDANGCSAAMSTSVAEPDPLQIQNFYGNVSCYGGSDGFIYPTVTGGILGYQYHWSNGATSSDILHLATGVYVLTVTDAHACSAILTTNITQPNSALAVYTHQTNVACDGDSTGAIQLTSVGGVAPYSYSWDNGMSSQNISSLRSGDYTVTVTDANYCTVSTLVTLTQGPGMMMTVNHTNVTCFGKQDGTIFIHASGGVGPYLYHWSNNGATQNGQYLAAGTYQITVEDGRHCTAMAMVNVQQPAPLTMNAIISSPRCYGDSNGVIEVTMNGGTPAYSYVWSNGSSLENLQQVAAGTYQVTVTDAHSCSASFTQSVNNAPPVLIQETHINPLCFGSSTGAIDITVAGGVGGYHYLWSNGSQNEDLLQVSEGNYSVTVTDANVCSAEKTITVTSPDSIRITELHHLPACRHFDEGTISLQVSGGVGHYQYSWSTGDSTSALNHLIAGTYRVTVSDENHCSSSLPAILLSKPDTVSVLLNVNDIACGGERPGQIQALASGGAPPYQYQWSDGSVNNPMSNSAEGIYSVTITDADGCSVVSSEELNEIPPMKITALADSLPCANIQGKINISVSLGTPPYIFAWSNGETSQNLQAVYPGEYSLLVTDSLGCTIDTMFTLVNLHHFTIQASGGGTVPLGETVELHAVSNGSALTQYQWMPEQNVQCSLCAHTTVVPTRYTLYTVVATDTNGCMAQDTVSADVIEDYSAFTPNAFTPNGDGNNDYFEFYGNRSGLKSLSIMIFDRWGEKIFEADDPYFKWDGRYRGELVNPGVYVYILKLVYINGRVDKLRKGSITVIR